MCFNWYGSATREQSVNLGALAVIAPTLERMDLAAVIDQHLPKDPQAEYAHGSVLSLLVAARLSSPVALINVPDWARHSGADLLWDIPPEKLNDDRLGRSLDAFYYQRHSILASVAVHVAQTFDVSLERLHYDPTHLVFHGNYDSSKPRSDAVRDLQRPSANDPPAHITFGHKATKTKIVHAGVTVAVDDQGAVPIFGHVTDGNHNGHTAIAEQFELMVQHLHPQRLLLVSDRGTFSAGHVARCHRQGFAVLCSAPWKDYRALYDQQRTHLHWKKASYLSLEQQRRRTCQSALPHEHYELAVLHHHLVDPESKEDIPCRVLFVYSTASAKVCASTRDKAVTRITRGLQKIACSVAEGRRHTSLEAVARRVAKLFGKRSAARYFHWEMIPLTAAEQAALPAPARGCRRPSHRFVFHYEADLADADAHYDGLSVLVTSAAREQSGDSLFAQFKQQNEVELSHHQWKTPLAVHPLFLKNPRRVEALIHLLLIALTAYYLIQRQYRQHVPPEAPVAEQRMTTETILRAFHTYTAKVERRPIGRVIYPTQLSKAQRQILQRLHLPTPAHMLSQKLPHQPP